MQKKLIAIVAASAFALSAVAPAYAGGHGGWFPPPPPPHHSKPVVHHGHTGAWIVGSVVVSAASLITCAAIISKKYNRELTQREAWAAAAIPFGCLLVPPSEKAPAVVRVRG